MSSSETTIRVVERDLLGLLKEPFAGKTEYLDNLLRKATASTSPKGVWLT